MRLITDNFGNMVNADKIIGVQVFANIPNSYFILLDCEFGFEYRIIDENSTFTDGGLDKDIAIKLSNAIQHWLLFNTIDNVKTDEFFVKGVKILQL